MYGSVVFVINTDFGLVRSTTEHDTTVTTQGSKTTEKDCFIIGKTVVKYQTV